MKKTGKILSACVIMAVMSGCGQDTSDITPVMSETTSVTTTFNEYLLVRRWTADELLESIYFCGEYHKLPVIPSENEGFVFSDGYVYFPDGSQAYTVTDENGNVIGIRFERLTAPSDLSVFGVGLDSVPDDIPEKIGIADSIYGDKEETMTYSFFNGGIRELTFVYKNKVLDSIYICA